MESQRIRSLLVGLGSAALDAGLFGLCTLIWAGGVALLVARWLCAAASALLNFTGNRRWVFARRGGRFDRQLARYSLAALAGISLATLVWWALVGWTAWDPRLLHLISLSLVWLGFTFPVLRGWVFRTA
jgi:putative flippase GtrA